MQAESRRLVEAARRHKHWRRWGPYVADRAWGTVREDYSQDGNAWAYFPHDHARSRAYRWGEDGIGGWCDNRQRLCFAFAFWNGRDPILKERFFGLSNPEGSHGEDVKELYYYLDATPTHTWNRMLYKYPQREYPYAWLVEQGRRPRHEPECELMDGGVFEDDRYFDLFIDYAKASVDDTLIQLTAVNRGPDPAPLHVLPTLWFRNTWSWNRAAAKPNLRRAGHERMLAQVPDFGYFELWCENPDDLLFTENETNRVRLYGQPNVALYVKDAFHDYVVQGQTAAVNPEHHGTKACGWYRWTLAPGESRVVRLRLRRTGDVEPPEERFDEIIAARRKEADEFYSFQPPPLSTDERRVQRQAFAGLLWTKQYYQYIIEDWLKGDAGHPPPPSPRANDRNRDWVHLFNSDILSMPDKWEYPWYAAWDTAFHMVPFTLVDSDFAKRQLELFLREWYMHPNGQIPAYEWNFNDVNPPVHAWAVWRVYKADARIAKHRDTAFLEGCFHKLLMNFTWWVNRKDSSGDNIFEGGFLGLDNIGIFDRSKPLPVGGYLEQSDGTSWMAFYCLTMLKIATELAQTNPAYEDIASKFFEHFVYIAHAMNSSAGTGLWDETDGFYYDRIRFPDHSTYTLRVRSMVGLIPLFATLILSPAQLTSMKGFLKRTQWFVKNRPDLMETLAWITRPGIEGHFLLSLVDEDRLRRILTRMLDEREFLSPYGLRGLSKWHEKNPVSITVNGETNTIRYEPGESQTGMFGGNSNWRGPIWFPVNYLLLESLLRFHHYYGNEFLIECPTGSGRRLPLERVVQELSARLAGLFLQDESGRRAFHGTREKMQRDPHFRDHLLFHEYFDGDTGRGLGANHQTGWTALIAKILHRKQSE